ncbi:hypothetical protein ELZ19_06925 [Brucella abortus]|uniref:hypothetical protein n=1 Tax=Brucella abortus TaxID=235 RepID=UPI0005C7D232|nr:hypothetical protein [Brucella abortus]RUQ67303.1 hypothetical protein ELZ23_15355 [Brucella abortus]RUQ78566.1 hypothetical protein ELZ22_16970 [Brucella abortus]RUQ88308.1 hypothetical protein ELZ18_15725 [Brucella abortus]RUQ90338.1 hypothetical protein ELZ20_15725 [Brucella abortus]RUQ96502.1 hypothetical protein ELZ21_15420 [Brucella abortus]
MSKGRVFVVQRPAYFDRHDRRWVDKYDLAPAATHGELVFLLKPGNIYRDRLGAAIDGLREKLSDYGPDDHIMAVGDPVAIASAVLVAAEHNGGSVSLLKFDRISGTYTPYRVGASPNEG